MYSHGLSCNASLGTNGVIEEFPIGRRLAFDPARGRRGVRTAVPRHPAPLFHHQHWTGRGPAGVWVGPDRVAAQTGNGGVAIGTVPPAVAAGRGRHRIPTRVNRRSHRWFRRRPVRGSARLRPRDVASAPASSRPGRGPGRVRGRIGPDPDSRPRACRTQTARPRPRLAVGGALRSRPADPLRRPGFEERGRQAACPPQREGGGGAGIPKPKPWRPSVTACRWAPAISSDEWPAPPRSVRRTLRRSKSRRAGPKPPRARWLCGRHPRPRARDRRRSSWAPP